MGTIDKYKEAFQEEAREVLTELESALLELNDHPADHNLVGRVFRALHTIKGSGAMFGFDDVAAFTHQLENAFDLVRNGKMDAGSDLIGISLASVDQIKAMLAEAAGRGHADKAVANHILARVRELTGAGAAGDATKPAAPPEPPPPPANAIVEWNIRFAPGPDLLRHGANPGLLFRELRQLGTLRMTADTSAVPPLAEIDPERCYLSWKMQLKTAAGPEQIRDVFIFVEDSCELTIESSAASPSSPLAVPAHVPGDPSSSTARTAASAAGGDPRSGSGRRAADHSSSIRVAAVKIDQLIDLVAQLVTVQARLGEIAATREDRDIQSVAEEIEALTGQLRATSMGMRTLPLKTTFERFKRLVYDLSRALRKEVELTFEGAETELDKTVIDQLSDPLMHLIRNSMDHGIEAPEIRLAAGKPATGSVHLCARHAGAQVLVSVTDDGKGIDREAVRAHAIEKGLIPADVHLPDSEIFSLIMAPGFSTAREISDISGRGVGMDVVKRNVEALRGSIDISSEPGVGSTMTLRLPLTLAIIDGLLVRVDRSHFVLPLSTIVECIELARKDVERDGGKQVVCVRGEIVPYIRVRDYFNMPNARPDREQILITETEEGRCGFAVDQVLGDHQTVIKNLGRFYRHVDVISGATILGNGAVALILDPQRMVRDAIRIAVQNQRPSGTRSKAATAARTG